MTYNSDIIFKKYVYLLLENKELKYENKLLKDKLQEIKDFYEEQDY